MCDRVWHDVLVVNAVVDVHADDPEFGYRLIADELQAAGHQVSERRVWRLCREHRIWSTTTKQGPKSSGKTPGPAVHDDLVQRDFNAPRPDAVWLLCDDAAQKTPFRQRAVAPVRCPTGAPSESNIAPERAI